MVSVWQGAVTGREKAEQTRRLIKTHAGKVYDVTEFLDGEQLLLGSPIHGINNSMSLQDHPGGSKIILKYAGKDAT